VTFRLCDGTLDTYTDAEHMYLLTDRLSEMSVSILRHEPISYLMLAAVGCGVMQNANKTSAFTGKLGVVPRRSLVSKRVCSPTKEHIQIYKPSTF